MLHPQREAGGVDLGLGIVGRVHRHLGLAGCGVAEAHLERADRLEVLLELDAVGAADLREQFFVVGGDLVEDALAALDELALRGGVDVGVAEQRGEQRGGAALVLDAVAVLVVQPMKPLVADRQRGHDGAAADRVGDVLIERDAVGLLNDALRGRELQIARLPAGEQGRHALVVVVDDTLEVDLVVDAAEDQHLLAKRRQRGHQRLEDEVGLGRGGVGEPLRGDRAVGHEEHDQALWRPAGARRGLAECAGGSACGGIAGHGLEQGQAHGDAAGAAQHGAAADEGAARLAHGSPPARR